ncbi:MotA/TolQ/ExbB proton channel family protein [Salmonella enterica subsp. salamae]|nr:MotA/TolQ/ExbB proton channel family protein [Salmonella enterica]EDT4215615.1 MotA/TolQ/ExbB proton channel family protein [Salmonella enterica subsp. salamae]
MYFLGLIFYVLTATCYLLFPAIKNMVNQAAFLAPQITYACGLLFILPLLLFLTHIVFRLKARRYYVLLATQTKLAASVAVSLGLIGTFMGLTDMVSAIAGSLGGEGDLAAKMGAMISSISSALTAMSFAFLTSILGVAVSVLLLVSLNFWEFYYETENNAEKTPGKAPSEDELHALLNRIMLLEEINTNLANKLVCIPDNTNLAEQLAVNSNTIAENLSQINTTIKSIEVITKAFAETSDNALVSINTSLMDVNQNNMVVNEKIIASNERLMDLNIGISTLLTLMKKISEFNEEMENKKAEQLKVIIDRQENYFHEQYKLNKKMKQVVEVLSNEN